MKLPHSQDFGTPKWNKKYAELRRVIEEKLPEPKKGDKG